VKIEPRPEKLSKAGGEAVSTGGAASSGAAEDGGVGTAGELGASSTGESRSAWR
jgi:hypothetical protein